MVNKSDVCWFCQKNLATDTYSVNLEKKEFHGARFTIRETTVPIPHCVNCRSGKKNLMLLFWLAIGIPGGAFMFLIQSPSRISLIVLIASIIVSITLFVLAFFRMKDNSARVVGNHPDVAAAIKDGYTLKTIV